MLVSSRRDARGLSSLVNGSIEQALGADGKPLAPLLEPVSLTALMATTYHTDAHFTTYHILDASGRPLPRAYRLRKEALGVVLASGHSVETTCIVLDLDLKHMGHVLADGSAASWTDLAAPARHDLLQGALKTAASIESPLTAFTAAYTTLHGFRFLHALAIPVPTSAAEPLIASYIRAYHALGLPADLACKDWTRLFRAPRVTRESGIETEHQPWFFSADLTDDTHRWHVPSPEDLTPTAVQVSNPSPILLDRPDPDEAELLIYNPDRSLTDLGRRAEALLRSFPIHAYIFGGTPPALSGSRHDTLASCIGLLTKAVAPDPAFTPASTYGLAIQMAKLLGDDEDWVGKAWHQTTAFLARDRAPFVGVVDAAQQTSIHASASDPTIVEPNSENRAPEIGPKLDPSAAVLSRTDDGVPYNTPWNLTIALRSQQMQPFRDLFTGKDMMLTARGAIEVTDDMEVLLRSRLQKTFGFKKIKPLDFHDFLTAEAIEHQFNPALHYFNSLIWDKTPRLANLFPDYFGSPPSAPIQLNQEFAKLFMASAVRRVRTPGSKIDEVIVLEGPQGSLKSSAIKNLCPYPNWYVDCMDIDADPKTVIEQTRGKLFVELAELQGSNRNQIERTKAMLSRQVDTARPAYGRRTLDVPRQFVFWASTNDSHYLRDLTGNRRFWPVEVGQIDQSLITQDRDQLWAEAAHIEATTPNLRLNPRYYLDAATLTQNRTATDPWAEALIDVLDTIPVENYQIRSLDLWDSLGVERLDDRAKNSSRFGTICKAVGLVPLKKGKAKIIYRVHGDPESPNLKTYRWSNTAKRFVEARGTPESYELPNRA